MAKVNITKNGPAAMVAGFVCATIGAALLTGAGFAAKSEIDFRREAVTVDGVVVDLERSRSKKGGSTYYPVVEYADRSGATHRVRGAIGTNPPTHERGERVPVHYRSENPDDARLDGFVQTWFKSLILGGFGMVFAAIGAVVVRLAMGAR